MGIFLITALFLSSSSLFAQFNRGQISGFIKDPAGLFIPGVTVTILNEATSETRTATTENNGFFLVPNLDVGFYTVTVELTGFKKFVKTTTKVDANAKVSLDVVLEVGTLNETVTVTADAAELQKDSATLGRIVDSKQIESLVVFGRNPQNLIRLKAGVRGGGTSSGESTTDGGFNIAGSRGDENVVIQDGAIMTRTRSAGSMNAPVNIDSVSEVQVLTSNYNAEYGRSSGGQIRYVTKGGTQAFHGGLFHSFRNAALNANSWGRNAVGASDISQSRRPAPFRFNQFGFDIGGPVLFPGFNSKKDKLFFYYAQEWIRNRSEDSRTWTVPTLAMRAGNFSELLDAANKFTAKVTPIIDPLTKVAFPGNIIPSNRLSPNGVGLLKSYPEPIPGFSPAGSSANFYEAVPAWSNYAKELVKVDYVLNSQHRISFRGSLFQWHSLGRTEATNRPGRSATLSWTWTLRNNLINEANFSPSLDLVYIDIAPALLAKYQKRSQFGINYPYLFPGTKVRDDKIPTILMDRINTNDGSRLPLSSTGPIYVFNDSMTWIKRTHMFKWGVVIERSGENDYDQINVSTTIPGATNNANGSFEFRDNRANGTTNAIANAALGLFSNYGEVGTRSYTPWRATAMDLFFQDTWKVRPNFTVEYGVRYVYWPPWHSLWGNIAEFYPQYYDKTKMAVVDRTAGYIISGDPYNGIVLPGTGWPAAAKGRVNVAKDSTYDRLFKGLPGGFAETKKAVFEPRLGLAYSLNQKTVIRSGIGMFHNRVLLNDSTLLGGNAPIQPMSGVSEGSADAPGGSVQRQWPFLITANPYDWNHPTSWAWNLTVQHQLPWGITIESAYVGRRSYYQPRERNINQLLPGTRQLAVNTGANTDFLRPYPGLGIIRASEHSGQSWYNGWQNEITRRFRNGVSFGVAYTWSRTTNNSDGKRTLLPNAYDDSAFWGLANFHRKHLLIANYVWEIPFLKGNNSVLGKVVGGWQVAGIFEFQSGSPVNGGEQTFGAGWRSWDQAGVGVGSGQQPYNLVGDWKVANPKFSVGTAYDQNFYFNPTAFSAPPAGTYGNMGRNVIIGPNQWNTDLALSKVIRFHETKSFQLRADFLNFPNHPNWSNPNGDPSSSTFGRVTGKGGNRQIQITSTFRF
jgi:hypothetical protein